MTIENLAEHELKRITESIEALLRAERINILDKEKCLKSLAGCVAGIKCMKIYEDIIYPFHLSQ
ncbi:hypothetical protein BB987_09310 [Photorhabdus temperata]|uniref:Uncharacterized protein n=1 Tax=Photorhabdus khanii NC19 TaxID=1004151 RepID=W3V5P4_9GAMM|nr:hypothetical protein [Photorhabdus khanii]ETS31098.1 hypothetical protein PTE_03050 [Photorhabdus khanii NC19]OHV54904.1 hypothetical protein BB987_09310 [Photorhabdus temperata]